jgi:flagellar hook protein FlgE
VIDSATYDALSRIANRANDALHGFESGFEPAERDGARRNGASTVPDAGPLAVAAPRGAYFSVLDAAGERIYTRDGAFRFEDGVLRTRDGAAVLGRPLGAKDGVVAPLHIEAVDVALGRASDARIDADGSLSCALSTVDPRTGARRIERVVLGRVALARFPAGTAPPRVDATHVRAPAGVLPHVGLPDDGNFGALAMHARDLGALDPEAGIARLQEAYLSFEALQAAHRAHGDVEKTAMDLLK